MTNKIAEIVIFNVAATVGDRVVVAGVVRVGRVVGQTAGDRGQGQRDEGGDEQKIAEPVHGSLQAGRSSRCVLFSLKCVGGKIQVESTGGIRGQEAGVARSPAGIADRGGMCSGYFTRAMRLVSE